MMYLLAPEVHAQVLEALSIRDVRLHESALALLKAMQPAEVEAYLVYDPASCSEDLFFDGELGDMDGKTVQPLYTPTKD